MKDDNRVGDFASFLRAAADPAKKWAVLGKGPTSDYHCRYDWSEFNVISLNHAVRLGRPLVAHFVDLEALWDCEASLPAGQALAMPWHPHVNMRPDAKDLLSYAERPGPVSEALASGLLLSYNASCHAKLPPGPGLPGLRLRYFSSVACFAALAAAGAKTVYSLGVDGGGGYGSSFDPKDRLKNGRKSFDDQEAEIARICGEGGVAHVRLRKCTTR